MTDLNLYKFEEQREFSYGTDSPYIINSWTTSKTEQYDVLSISTQKGYFCQILATLFFSMYPEKWNMHPEYLNLMRSNYLAIGFYQS